MLIFRVDTGEAGIIERIDKNPGCFRIIPYFINRLKKSVLFTAMQLPRRICDNPYLNFYIRLLMA